MHCNVDTSAHVPGPHAREHAELSGGGDGADGRGDGGDGDDAAASGEGHGSGDASAEGEGSGDASAENVETIIGAVWIASTETPTTPALLRAVCNALALENMPAESASTLLAACAAGTPIDAVMMTEPGLISRLTAETVMDASFAMALLIPACVT